jgi:hypothetical protein
VVGRAFADVDPAHPLNAGIVNLGNTSRNAAGRVEYWFDFYLLKPVDLRKGSRRIFYDVLNRGNKLALNNLNNAPGMNDLTGAGDAGNGFLMRQGYSLLWSGWQGDVAEGDNRLLAGLPVATSHGAPIVAISRDEFIFEHSHNPSSAPLSCSAHTLDQREATLTVRQREQDTRTPIAPDRWRYVLATRIEITRPAGFDAGAIYEFIYPARDPIVMGLGFAAVRDFIAFMRHERYRYEWRPESAQPRFAARGRLHAGLRCFAVRPLPSRLPMARVQRGSKYRIDELRDRRRADGVRRRAIHQYD